MGQNTLADDNSTECLSDVDAG